MRHDKNDIPYWEQVVEALRSLPAGAIITAQVPTDYGTREAKLVAEHKITQRFLGKEETTYLFKEIGAKSPAREASWFGVHRVSFKINGLLEKWTAKPSGDKDYPWLVEGEHYDSKPYWADAEEFHELVIRGTK